MAGVVEVLAVVDAQGRKWTPMPEAWVANAALCSARERYDASGDAYAVWCRQRSQWCCGEVGYCSRHFVAQLNFGDSKAGPTRAANRTGFGVSEKPLRSISA